MYKSKTLIRRHDCLTLLPMMFCIFQPSHKRTAVLGHKVSAYGRFDCVMFYLVLKTLLHPETTNKSTEGQAAIFCCQPQIATYETGLNR